MNMTGLIIFLTVMVQALGAMAEIDNTIELQYADNYDVEDGYYLISSVQGNYINGTDLSEYGVTKYIWQRSVNGAEFKNYYTTASPNFDFTFGGLGYTYAFRRCVINSDGDTLYSNELRFKCTSSASTANVCQYQPFGLIFNGPKYDNYQWYMNDGKIEGQTSIKLSVSDGLEASASFYLDCSNNDEDTHYKSYYIIKIKELDELDEIKDEYTLLPGEESHFWTWDDGDTVTLYPGEYYSYYNDVTMRYPVCQYQVTTLSVRHNSTATMPDYTVYYNDSKVGDNISGFVSDENGDTITDLGSVQYFIYDSASDSYIPISVGTILQPGEYRMYITFTPNDANTYPSAESDIATVIVKERLEIASVNNYQKYCTGDYMDLEFSVLKGVPTEYRLEFSDSCDLEPVDWTPLEPDLKIVYQVNDYEHYGDNYSATLTIRGEDGSDTSIVYNFGLNIPNWYVHSKYHDVVFVDNHEDLFVGYQWFKDGEEQPGKVGQFWQDVSGDNQGLEGWYMAEVTTIYGDKYFTCPVFYDDLRISNHFFATAFPNPVCQNSEVSIELKDISDEDLMIAQIYIYSASGKLSQIIHNVDRLNVTTLPFGEYVAKVVVGKQVQSLKIIVR